jgi:hypothetical protein
MPAGLDRPLGRIEETPNEFRGETKDFFRFLNKPGRGPRFVGIKARSGSKTTRTKNPETTTTMNTLTLIRTVSLAALCIALSSTSHAADRAAQAMASQGAVSVSNIGPSLKIGSTEKEVYKTVGQADAVLADGTLLFHKSFYIDHSAANGSLVVEFSGGKVSALRIVSPFEAAAMVSKARPSTDVTLVASIR